MSDNYEHTTGENVVPLHAPEPSAQDTAALEREFVWDESQQTAIDRCCDMQERIVPVTGPAGTGKTTLIREVYKRLTKAGYHVVLCAPTGKAAKRIQEATGIPAMTIHRLLEYPHPGERDEVTGQALLSTDPKRKKSNPIDQQVVLCDEYAMVNKEVHSNLVFALPPGGRICMFGDVNQLTPIEKNDRTGKASPFQTALKRFEKVAVTLQRIHRTTEGSGIAENGSRILKGRIPAQRPDFKLNVTTQPVRELEDHVMEWLDRGVNYGSNGAQVIVQQKTSWVGTYKLNLALQRLLVPMSVNGVSIALLGVGLPFTFTALLGLLSLSGMLIKNGIVLVEEIDITRREQPTWPLKDAIVTASTSRLRPVILAAATTILGMIPLISDAFFQSMAVTIMGGLAFASILTLIAAPVFYYVFFARSETASPATARPTPAQITV